MFLLPLNGEPVHFRLAIRCVVIARLSVTVGNNPSGTLATMMPIANIRFSQNGSPIMGADSEKISPREVANIATSFDRRAISFKMRLPLLCLSQMGNLPKFSMPSCCKNNGLDTSPKTIQVPASKTLAAARCDDPYTASAIRDLGNDSPVTVAMFTLTPAA